MVEQRFRKPQVTGSIPVSSLFLIILNQGAMRWVNIY